MSAFIHMPIPPRKARAAPEASCGTHGEHKVTRRNFALSVGATFGAALCSTRFAKAQEEPAVDVEGIAPIEILDLGNGVRAEVVSDGEGPEVQSGSQVTVRWVLRRANGYFIDASYGFGRFEALTYTAGQGKVIPAFETAVTGMRSGGRRRFTVPAKLGYVAGTKPGSPGPIPPSWGARRSLAAHRNENLVFEVHVTKVRSREQ